MRLPAVPLLLLTIAICCGEDAAPAKLDRFNLANGRTIVGTIESQTDEAYTIKLVGGAGGTIIMKKDRVLSIDARAADPPAPRPPKEPGADDAAAATVRTPVAKPPPPVDPSIALRAEAAKAGVQVTAALAALVHEGQSLEDVIKILGKNYIYTPLSVGQAYNCRWSNNTKSFLSLRFSGENNVINVNAVGLPSSSP